MRPTDGVNGDVFFNRPGVAVMTWDLASRAVCIEWEGWATPTEFAALLEAGLTGVVEHHASRWLGDCRYMKAIQQSDQDWIVQSWFPRLLQAGVRRMAAVIPKSGLAKMNLEDILIRVPGTHLDVAYFATVEEARRWLVTPSTITPTSRPANAVH
jgi:SpoIIAA-like